MQNTFTVGILAFHCDEPSRITSQRAIPGNHLHFVLLQTLFYEDDYRSNAMLLKLLFMSTFEGCRESEALSERKMCEMMLAVLFCV